MSCDDVDGDGSEFNIPVPKSANKGCFPPPTTTPLVAEVIERCFVSSFLISHRAMAATRIQRVVRSTLSLAYSKVYAAAFLTPGIGIPSSHIKSMRLVSLEVPHYYYYYYYLFFFVYAHLYFLLQFQTDGGFSVRPSSGGCCEEVHGTASSPCFRSSQKLEAGH